MYGGAGNAQSVGSHLRHFDAGNAMSQTIVIGCSGALGNLSSQGTSDLAVYKGITVNFWDLYNNY